MERKTKITYMSELLYHAFILSMISTPVIKYLPIDKSFISNEIVIFMYTLFINEILSSLYILFYKKQMIIYLINVNIKMCFNFLIHYMILLNIPFDKINDNLVEGIKIFCIFILATFLTIATYCGELIITIVDNVDINMIFSFVTILTLFIISTIFATITINEYDHTIMYLKQFYVKGAPVPAPAPTQASVPAPSKSSQENSFPILRRPPLIERHEERFTNDLFLKALYGNGYFDDGKVC